MEEMPRQAAAAEADEVKYLGLAEIGRACDRFLEKREPGYAERKAKAAAQYARGRGNRWKKEVGSEQ
jgi:hypothetical protein